jgi:hypothetical protein
MQTINIELTETILDDLRNFFGGVITIDNVPAKDIDNRHVALSSDADAYPQPDEKIEHDCGSITIYRYELFSVDVFIAFSDGDTLFILGKNKLPWRDFFAYIESTQDPIILAVTMADYKVCGTDFRLDGITSNYINAACNDDFLEPIKNVAIWVEYHYAYEVLDRTTQFGFLYEDDIRVMKTFDYFNPFKPRIFENGLEAKKLIQEKLKFQYVCAPYELARPIYKIVRTK